MPQDENSGGSAGRHGGPNKVSRFLGAFLPATAAFSLVAAVFGLRKPGAGLSLDVAIIAAFFAAAVTMTYLFLHVRSVAVIAPPVIAVALALAIGASLLPTLIVSSAVLVISAAAAVMLLKRTTPFIFFLVVSALFFVAAGLFAFVTLKNAYGSFSAGVEELKKAAAAAVDSAVEALRLSGRFDDTGIDTGALTDAVFALIPSAAMILSMICAVIFTAVLKLATKVISGTRDLLFPEKLVTPIPFAVIFIISVVTSFLSGSFPAPFSYAAVNIHYVLMAYFAGIGFLEILRSVSGFRLTSGRKTAVILLTVAAVVIGWFAFAMFVPVLLPILSYFGVFRSLKLRKKPDKPR